MFELLFGFNSIEAILKVFVRVINRLEQLADAEIAVAGKAKARILSLQERQLKAEADIARAKRIAVKIRQLIEEE